MSHVNEKTECIVMSGQESDPPTDCQSCQEGGFLDQFGNQRQCATCTLWHASYEDYLREIEAFEV